MNPTNTSLTKEKMKLKESVDSFFLFDCTWMVIHKQVKKGNRGTSAF